jgi:hypothetical protein
MAAARGCTRRGEVRPPTTPRARAWPSGGRARRPDHGGMPEAARRVVVVVGDPRRGANVRGAPRVAAPFLRCTCWYGSSHDSLPSLGKLNPRVRPFRPPERSWMLRRRIALSASSDAGGPVDGIPARVARDAPRGSHRSRGNDPRRLDGFGGINRSTSEHVMLVADPTAQAPRDSAGRSRARHVARGPR